MEIGSYRKPAQRIDDVPTRKSWRAVAREYKDRALTVLLIISAVIGALFLALGDATDHTYEKQYPAPLVKWASNMNGRVTGAQCETVNKIMICDVELNGRAIHKVQCENGTCWLQTTQEHQQ